MMKLGLNIDHVATLRQARGARYPNVVRAALICEEAGADAYVIKPFESKALVAKIKELISAGTK